MSKRFRAFAAATLLAMGAAAVPAFAQAPAPDQAPQLPDQLPGPAPDDKAPPSQIPPPPGSGEPPKLIEPPANLPRPQTGDAKLNLDKLFEALKIAPSEDSAKFVEGRIWALWLAAGGDTGNLLMTRVKTAMDGKDYDLATKLLNAIIDIKPDYVEAWNRRATIRFTQKDFTGALADISEVLKREPRHFGALSGLGMIMQELGDEKTALEAFRRALAVHPKLEKIPEMVKRLTEKVEGRDI
jgi:tetratricopeptide (TPR) repeat protein